MDRKVNDMTCGLGNMGNSCYLNSTIQCLAHTAPLTEYIFSKKYIKDINNSNKETRFLDQYVKTLIYMWNNPKPAYPRTVKDLLAFFANEFEGNKQCDAHESIIKIIDLLHESLSYEASIKTINLDAIKHPSEVDKMMIASFDAVRKHFKKSYSELVKIFYGQFHSIISCKNCDNKSITYDPFNCIEIEIPDDCDSLTECLDSFTNHEILDSNNEWKCDKCNKFSNAHKQIRFWSTPQILIIVLKRFKKIPIKITLSVERTKTLIANKKITKLIDFPIGDFDIARYLNCPSRKYSTHYSLYSICNHMGSTDGGHYTAFCQNLDGNWYEYNDETVSKIDDSKLVSSNAYVLFYQRNT